MYLLDFAATQDPSQTIRKSRLAKVTGTSLPLEQNLMRLLYAVENSHLIVDKQKPGCDWRGVHCNVGGDVLYISWPRMELRGELNFELLPSKMERFYIHDNHLSGEFLFEYLPLTLEFFSIKGNRFTGNLNFHYFSESIKYIDLGMNFFSGTIDFSLRPLSLREIYLNGNTDLEGHLQQGSVLLYDVQGTRITTNEGELFRRKNYQYG